MVEIDPFLKSSEVAKARNWSTRWLYEQVQRGDFPPPDRPSTKRGEPNLWRASTVKAALDRLQASSQSSAAGIGDDQGAPRPDI